MSERRLAHHRVERFVLESGVALEDVRQAYHLDGELAEGRDNLVLVFHSLTSSADAVGDWWADVFGPGRAVDTRRWAVLCPNLLGSCYGTTWARAVGPAGEAVERPRVTPRDMVRLVGLLLRELDVREVALVTGGSLGGMLCLEWAAEPPAPTRAVVSFAAPAAHSAQSIAWSHIQREAIRLAGPAGLAVARMVAMMTYRTAHEFDARFGRATNEDGSYRMESYLSHHGEKLVSRFELDSYLTLIDAMDSHDVGRDRDGVRSALAGFAGRLLGVGIPGDLLYRDEEVRAWVDAAGAEYRALHSPRGHDAFLLEPDQVATILAEVLGDAGAPRHAGRAAARPDARSQSARGALDLRGGADARGRTAAVEVAR